MTTAEHPVRSTVPARLDRLPWSRFHWRVVIALGITWVLDGLEITVASTIADRLRDAATLGLTSSQVGLGASLYLLGEVGGALYFGRLTDKVGRRKLFLLTLGVYLIGNALTALSMNLAFFGVTRFIAGTGIGDGDDRGRVFLGYGVASVLMIIGGVIEFIWGVDAEGRSLEAVATPLSAQAVAACCAQSGLTGGLTSHVRRGPAPGRGPDELRRR
jgi:MFS family permease